MNRFMKGGVALLLAAVLAACGGGGGSPGATGTGGTGGTGTGGTGTGGTGTGGTGTGTPVPAPTVSMTLVNSSGSAIAGNAVTSGSTVFVKALVRDAAGTPVANKLVTFTATTNAVTFQPASGQVLTDTSGVATVQVSPANVNTAGADTVVANTTVDQSAVGASIDVQTSAANVGLSSFSASQTNLTAYQNTSVGVAVSVNGQAATSTPVTVGFTASCGTFSPPSATSDSTGRATTTFQAGGCAGGTATLTASAPGATPVQTTVTVQAPQATNLLFVAAAPPTIYTAAASSGAKQSTVRFRVVDAAGNPIVSSQVQVSLSPASIAAGVTFADTGTTTPKVIATDATGEVAVIVKSGGFPTPLSLDAVLVGNNAINASSAGLSVNSGRAVQNFFSPSAQVYNIEGWRYDGETTNLTVRVADRLGQPVPAGTPVSFISEGGQVTASCTLQLDGNGQSACSSTLSSQALRPANGRVTVLSYMDGDEIFIDGNGNNRFDAGETFFELGQPFLDSDEDGTVDTGEQKVGDASVPGSGIGGGACAPHANLIANVPNTCDGTWGPTRVRGQAVFVFSDSFVDVDAIRNPTLFTNVTNTGVTVNVQDFNRNPLPAGSSVTATVSGGVNCSIKEVIPATVPSTTSPTQHRVIVGPGSSPGDTCTGAEVSVKVATPKGNVTLLGSRVLP